MVKSSRKLVGVSFLLVGGALTAACLDRPVSPLKPQTTNSVVFSLRQETIEKIDLLFMIDNSSSMGDKQDMLKRAIPKLVGRLVNPACVSDSGDRQNMASPDAECPEGYRREFKPLEDIHIGVITSSIELGLTPGSCGDNGLSDNGRLIGTLPRGNHITTYQNKGFLAWDPKGKLDPPGEANADRLIGNVQEMVTAVGESGCGFEASLEAWYRFLVDPEPVHAWVNEDGKLRPDFVDDDLLAQRRDFLRPDSLLALVMLTDENDCSVVPKSGVNNLGVDTVRMPRASSACSVSPDDPCCYSCTDAVPEGCPATDAECSKGERLTQLEDQRNLRCFQQKRRFGVDYLQPIQRYVDGLTKPLIKDSSGREVQNPLFPQPTAGKFTRTPKTVLVAGILGVPWQDVVSTDVTCEDKPDCVSSLPLGAPVSYLTAAELSANKRWDMILGDPVTGAPAQDPLMWESVEQRSGSNPVLRAPLVPANSNATPSSNPINGHEWNIAERNDLQYSCIFPLAKPPADGFECKEDQYNGQTLDKPICERPDGTYTDQQTYGRAFPTRRELQVLAGIEDAAVVASICPKEVSDEDSPSFGYSPAAEAIGDRVSGLLNGKCLQRALEVTPDGVSCKVVEATRDDTCGCDGSRGRKALNGDLDPIVRRQLKQNASCGAGTGVDCESYCLCEIEQARGETLSACLSEDAVDGFGWCYINEEATPQGKRFVQTCPADRRQLLRFVGDDTPRNGADVYVACRGVPTNE